jgi:23S rRNA pseudouridine1911/1915/1917 synthase
MASISVLYEDNHLIIINKPPGALVQADKTGDQPITNDVKAYIKEHYDKPGDVFLGVIHRIDRPVSGVVIFARTSKALERMNEMFKNREVQKTYWAVTGKIPNPTEGVLKHYTIKDSERHKAKIFPKEMPDSKACELSYRLIAESERYFLLEVEPKTGRYHQIRAQLSYIGCPIKGDIKYNWPRTNEDGSIHLHARSVTFIHPVKKTPITVTAPVPDTDAVWKYFASL